MSVFEHCAFEVMWADECIWVGFVRLWRKQRGRIENL